MRTCSIIVSLLLASLPAAHTDKPDYDATIRLMRAELGDGFIVEKSPPFVIAGNISPASFKRIVFGTIRTCSRALYKDFFERKPAYVIRVYLFANDKDYHSFARKLFGDTPTTRFGYYRSTEEALVMNIATGTGTLVHEMTHALMKPDFPQVPTWFNEGLASLFEQCLVRDGSLIGLVNWRFPILTRAIKQDKLIPLTDLVASSTEQFYGKQAGLYYAEARYFCFYLQEKKILRKFYKEFRNHFKKDPTGRISLEKLLGKPLAQAEGDWLDWTRTLHLPATPPQDDK